MANPEAFPFEDQTPHYWKNELFAKNPGTGLLLLYNQNKLVPLRDITYEDFRQAARGYDTNAIKWIPNQVYSFEQLQQLGNCAGVFCTSRCTEPGCICDRYKHKSVGL